MNMWHIGYSYVNSDGDVLDAEEYIMADTIDEAMEKFNRVADAYMVIEKWSKYLAWGVKLMHKLGVDAVKEAE